MHSQVMFEALELMSLLINLLDIRWFQWKSEEQQDMVDWDYERIHESWVDGVWRRVGKEWKVMAMQGCFCLKQECC